MMVHRIVVEDQSLRWYGRPPKIADDSIEFVRFQFHLPEDWDPLVLVAQFTQADTYNMLLDGDTCFLPKELTPGLCKLSLFGYAEGKPLRATSIPLVFQIEESGFVSSAETPIPPTPDLYAQLIEYFSSIAGSGGGGSGGGTINPEDIAAAVEDYLSKNPPEVPDLSDEVNRAETAASEAEAANRNASASANNAGSYATYAHDSATSAASSAAVADKAASDAEAAAARAEEAAKVTTDLDTTLTQEGKAADAKAVGDAISKLSGGNVDQEQITAAVNEALAEAKASGEFDGKDGKDGVDGKDGKDGSPGSPGADGVTPHVGSNGNWFIGEDDTGIPATGPAGGQGLPGTPGEDGQDGSPGKDGVTPHIGSNGNWYIGDTDTGKPSRGADGRDGEPGKDGNDGQPGKDGAAGSPGKDGNGIKSAVLNEDYTLTLTFDDDTTYTTPSIRGATGATGSTGQTGATGPKPVKGVDYWTDADQEEIVQQVITALGTPVFGRVDADNNIILTGNLADGTYTLKYEDADGNTIEIGTLDFGVSPDVALNLKLGKLDKSTGTISGLGTDKTYLHSDMIELLSGYTYTVLFKANCKLNANICYWDENDNYMASAYTKTDVSQPTEDKTVQIAVPDGAKYFRLRCYNYDYNWNDMNTNNSLIPQYLEYINTMVVCTRAKT